MSSVPRRDPVRNPPSLPGAGPSWTAAPGPAENALRRIQGMLVDPAADPVVVLAEVRAVLDAAGYPTDVLGGMDADLAADLFGRT